MKRALRRLVFAALVIAALLYPLYLAVGNAYLRGGWLEEKLNGRPERMWMHWSSAWTPWPGVVHVRGFSMRSQSSVFQWALAVDRATFDIDLLGLRRRELRIGPLWGGGVVFRLRRRLDAPPRSVPPQPELYPPIAGFSDPPKVKPEVIYPKGPPRPPWHMWFTGVDLDEVREIWIEEYRFAGRARVAGGFDTRVRRSLEVMPTRVEFLSGAFTMGKSSVILADARGRVDGRIDRYPPARFKGWNVFRFVSGRLELGGRVTGLPFLELFFRQMRWVDLRVGPGPLKADVRLRRGDILAGSRLDARPSGITLGFLDYQATGFGGVVWSVAPVAGRSGKGREGRLALAFDNFRLQRRGYSKAHVQGRGLRVDAVSAAPRLGGLFTPQRLAIDMSRAEVPDLTFYNAYLPRQSALALTSGSGRMSGRFQAAAPEWKGTGELHLTAPGLGIRFEEKRMRGNVKVHTRLRSVDLDDRRFDISGSDFELTDAVVLGTPGSSATGAPWWARGHFDRAVLAPGAPIYLRASAEGTLSDPRPLFALFAPVERSRMLRWVDRLLNIQGVGATADLTLGQDFFDLSNLAVAGGKAQVLGRLRVVDSKRRGILYASYGAFDVGLELEGAKRDWKILRPKRWFENYPPF